MDTHVRKRYYLIPLFYVGLIAALLYFQFAREEPFQLRFGIMSVSGHVIAGKAYPPALANIALRVSGLIFSFSRSTPVLVNTPGGPEQRVSIKSYSTIPNGIELTFTGGLTLRFVVSGEGKDNVSITPSTPEGIEVTSVSFPYGIAKGDQTRSGTGIPALAVTRQTAAGARTYVLSLPFNSEIRVTDHLLVLTATGGKFGPALYTPAERPNQDPVVYWFEQNGNLPDASTFKKGVGDYLEKAWSGWTKYRFDANTGIWQMRDGSPAFAESIVAALLSGALERGSYDKWLPVMRKAASLHPQDITIETTPYFGNLLRTYDAYRAVITGELQNARRQLQDAGKAALATPGLLKFLTDHGNQAETESLLAKIRQAKEGPMSLSTALALLDDDLAAPQLGYTGGGYAANATQLIDRQLLPSIIRTKSGFFLQGETGLADIASSVFAGSLLIKAGTQENNTIFEGIGRQLVLSSLALSDNEGFLPGQLTITGDSISGSEGFLAPEKIYPWIAPESYYPREISLAGKLGQGTWIWGASHVVSVSSTQNETAISFDFPPGMIEHIVVHGIKPFSSLRLYGTPWHSDRAFERYRAGWVYDAADETLFIKLQHQKQQETIDIIR